MMKRELNLSQFLIFAFTMLSVAMGYAQVSAPFFSINGNTTTRICVTPDAPNREALFTAQANFPSNTQFILELSDELGIFAQEARRLTSFTSTEPFLEGSTITFPSFEIPSDLRSDTFRIRIRFISPDDANIGAAREVAIHYFDNSERLFVTGPNPNTNLVAVCIGQETVTLRATPEDLPSYQWYFNGALLPGETGTTLENVSEPGEYRVVVDFGSCNVRFDDNESFVTVVNFENPTSVILEGDSRQEYCPSDIKILQCSIDAAGIIYEWYKDDVLIPNESQSSLVLPNTEFGGFYRVEVTGTDICSNRSTNTVEVINLGSNITRPPPQVVLLPGQTEIPLVVETDAPGTSTIEWFFNNVSQDPPQPISEVGALTFIADTPGTYTAILITDDFCNETVVMDTEVSIPSNIKVVIADVLNCDEGTGTIALENIFGVLANGDEVALSTEQYDFFNFEWFRAGESTGITTIDIELTDDDVGEEFFLRATIRGNTFPPADSDPLTPQLISGLQIEASSFVVTPFETVTITAPLSATYVYEWSRDGEVLLGEDQNTLEVDEPGTYSLIIKLPECEIPSNSITITGEEKISEVIPNVITPFGSPGVNDTWILPDRYSASDVDIVIYSPNGELVFEKSGGYNAEWPFVEEVEEPLYFYIIKENNAVVKKGTITVIR